MGHTIEVKKVKNSTSLFFCIKNNEQIISFVRCYPTEESNTWHINEIFTEEKYRKNGYATELLEYVIHYFKKHIQPSKLTLVACPDPDSKISVRQLMNFYNNYGFVKVYNTYNHMQLSFF